MAYNITYKKSVAKDLKRIDNQNAKRILDKIDETLVEDAEQFPALAGPFAGLRKFRVGDYRVIFAIMPWFAKKTWDRVPSPIARPSILLGHRPQWD